MINITRNTKETQIECTFDINGTGQSTIDTGVGFLNHMIESFAKHSTFDITLKCKGDVFIDDHHTTEDCGIVLGEAFRKSVFPILNIERFSNVTIVMDEAEINCNIDLSNRPYFSFDNYNIEGKIGSFDVELVEEFFHAFVMNGKITCHLNYQKGRNKHHIVEASFKALAVALRRALIANTKVGIPSTKGIL